MGNLISIHTIIFVKRDSDRITLNPIRILNELLLKYNGMSYNGSPIFVKESGNYENLHYKISYGEKGEPRELIEFAKSHVKLIDKIFARTYYESGDLDYFLSTPFKSDKYEIIRKPCRYGFDELNFKLRKGENFNGQIITDDSEFLRIKLDGEMSSISDLIELDQTEIIIKLSENYRSVKTYAINNFKSDKLNVLNEILPKVKMLYSNTKTKLYIEK